ncbi:cytochrome b [Alsobacter sp. SYSU M60028]|uniref:Cytochrome b n=1 Tax=Alsobacter ponti TaxID=2962936 RepID=A0ABT1LDS4_9HYPH|nr:cytochrome b [Alsobacter ponti]MCP8938388.1 cytochrome b [Alsobacter ponti]
MTSIASQREEAAGYSPAAKWLHWLVAVLVLVNFGLGLALERVPEGPIQNTFYDLHRSTGALILALAIIRLAVRLARGAPEPLPGLTGFERTASLLVHKALYVLIFVVPLLGWIATSAYGADIWVYGAFILPPFPFFAAGDLGDAHERVAAVLFRLHKLSAVLLVGLAGFHVAGALFHLLVRKDGVMARMLPGR